MGVVERELMVVKAGFLANLAGWGLLWVELCPLKKRYFEVLTSSITECDLIWK